MPREELENANPLDLIFVPENWMQKSHREDLAFDGNLYEQTADVVSMRHADPV